MEIILTKGEFTQLSEATRAEILALLSPPDPTASQLGPEFDGLDMDRVVNLTYKQVQEWMAGAADPTKAGPEGVRGARSRSSGSGADGCGNQEAVPFSISNHDPYPNCHRPETCFSSRLG